MTTYTVTPSNWNSIPFWSGISESGSGHVLDFSGLGPGFAVQTDAAAGIVTITSGSTVFTIGESGVSGTNANFGGSTRLDQFGVQLGGQGNDTLDGGADADTIDGGAGGDSIEAGDGADLIRGGTGADTIRAGAGNDTVYDETEINATASTSADLIDLGDGDDVFIGTGSGAFDQDTVYGGDGDDTISVRQSHDTVHGGDGDDLITSQDEFVSFGDLLSGDAGDDTIIGANSHDTILGGDGRDALIGGGGNDVIMGDAASVDLTYFASGQGGPATSLTVTNSADGPITLWWISQDGQAVLYRTIQPGQSFVQSTFEEHNWILRDPDGRDLQLIEGAPNQTIHYGAGGFDDRIEGGTGDDEIHGQYGDDTILGGAGDDTIEGGSGNDLLGGGVGSDTLRGGDGDDTLSGGTDWADIITQEDFVTGPAGWTFLATGNEVTGNESLQGDAFMGRFAGNATGAEQIQKTYDLTDDAPHAVIEFDFLKIDTWDENQAEGFTVYIDGAPAFTFFPDGAGSSVFGDGADAGGSFGGGTWEVTSTGPNGNLGFGGGGLAAHDRIYEVRIVLDDPGSAVTLGVGARLNQAVDDESWGIDNVRIASTNDPEFQFGTATDDDDLLDGGGGADTFIVADRFGDDTIIGGGNHDTIDLSALTNPVNVLFTGPGAGTITDSVTGDVITFSQIEALILTDGDDTVDATVDDGNTYIQTLDGNDFVQGSHGDDVYDDEIWEPDGAGNDTFIGGAGEDEIWAGTDDDSVRGGDGNDHLNGQSGDDTLHGDAGDDRLYGGIGNDVVSGGDGNDVITEYGFGGTSANDGDTVTGTNGAEGFVFAGDAGTNATIILDDGAGTANDGDAALDRLYVTSIGNGASLRVEGFSYDIDNIQLSEQWASLSTTQIAHGHHQVIVTYEDGNSQTLDILHDNGAEFDPARAIFTYAGDDVLDGGAGDDTILAAFGDDSIDGGSGNDRIEGEAGDDLILGGMGDDRITGGTGDDSIAGGSGNDTFIYHAGDGNDTITDFNSGNSGALSDGDSTNNDFIDLSAFYDHIREVRADQRDDGILNQSNGGVDYFDNASFGSGSLTFEGASTDGRSLTADNTGVVCFARGTHILTPQGEIPIERLRQGDLVITRDNGPQAIIWAGSRLLSAGELSRNQKLKPIWLAPALTGGDTPLIVSPQHGILVRVDGGNETLVRATHMAWMRGGKARVMEGCRNIHYHHVMFDAHQIIFANGAPTESFYPGKNAFAALCATARGEILSLFPDLAPADAGACYGEYTRSFLRFRDLPDRLSALAQASP